MSQTVVGLFKTPADAQRVRQELLSEGFASDSVRVLSNESDGFAEGAVAETRTGGSAETGVVASVKNFFRSLTSDETEQDTYTRGVSSGGALVAVTTSDERVESVISLLEAHGAYDVTEEGATTGTAVRANAGVGAAASTATAAGTAIPIVEEQLQVGKRQVRTGGVRVYSHVVETPVEEQVRLREEHVRVQRTPVDRPASAADFNTFKEGTVEMTEMGEEVVVGKQARVVEEVRVGKDVTERTETVRDKVRRTEVDVEEINADTDAKVKPAGKY